MSYTKSIAVIKGLKDGFSADGGALSGLVKAEKYSRSLRVEVKLINFAPLTEGRYVAAISDGVHSEIIENGFFEGQSDLDTGAGFAAVVCYVNGNVQLLASAVCGNFQSAVFGLKSEIERAEMVKPAYGGGEASAVKADIEEAENSAPAEKGDNGIHTPQNIPTEYEDEAIAEANYYEFDKTDESGEPVCEGAPKEEDGGELFKDEKGACPVEEGTSGLARGGFYDRMKREVEGLLSAYPHCNELENAIESSEWVKIGYGDGKFYVFGVLRSAGTPRYLCYGVPSDNASAPPESMENFASFLPVGGKGEGFWVMYQDADTGASVKISNT